MNCQQNGTQHFISNVYTAIIQPYFLHVASLVYSTLFGINVNFKSLWDEYFCVTDYSKFKSGFYLNTSIHKSYIAMSVHWHFEPLKLMFLDIW